MADMGLDGVNFADYENFGGGDFEPLPEGYYTVDITRAEMKDTRAGNKMLAVEFTVKEGPFERRLIFDNLNIHHPNETPRGIAIGTLLRMFKAIGRPPQNDTGSLVGGTLVVKLKVSPPRTDPRTGITYGQSNDVKGHLTLDDGYEKAQQTIAAQQAQQQAQQAQQGYAQPPVQQQGYAQQQPATPPQAPVQQQGYAQQPPATPPQPPVQQSPNDAIYNSQPAGASATPWR